MSKDILIGKTKINGKTIIVKVAKTGQNHAVAPQDVVNAVYKLCNGRYVKACEFPGYLRQLCKKFFGSVRGAKWEAKIIRGKKWTVKKFLKCVYQYCAPKYRSEKEWPDSMKYWSVRFFGSVRQAKIVANILKDQRKKNRNRHKDFQGVWPDNKLLSWVWLQSSKKPTYWPGYIIRMCQIRFGSCRHALWLARAMKDERKYKRR